MLMEDSGSYVTAAFAGTGVIPDYYINEYGDETAYQAPWLENPGMGMMDRVILGEGITGIGKYVFCDTGRLREAILPDSLTSIGEGAFYNSGLPSVTIPAAVTSIGKEALNCYFRVKSGNRAYASVDGVLYNRAKTELIRCPYNYQGTLTVPEGVKAIDKKAFHACQLLTEVKLPESLTVIEDSAFDLCTSLTAVTIPDGVERIGDDAFWYCQKLRTVTIGKGVKEIGIAAFAGDYRITDVYYNGTQEQWDAIDISYSNDDLLNATRHCRQ